MEGKDERQSDLSALQLGQLFASASFTAKVTISHLSHTPHVPLQAAAAQEAGSRFYLLCALPIILQFLFPWFLWLAIHCNFAVFVDECDNSNLW